MRKAELSCGLGRSWRQESTGYSVPDPELAALEAQRTNGLVKKKKLLLAPQEKNYNRGRKCSDLRCKLPKLNSIMKARVF